MEKIPVVVLFVITMCAYLLGSIVRSVFSKKISESMFGYYLYNGVCCIVCGLTLFFLAGCKLTFSTYSVLLGLLFGFVVAVQQVSNSAALSIGPLSYTEVIVSLSTVFTALSGLIFWDEPMKPLQFIGIAMMVVCFILSVKSDEESKKKSIRWFLLCLVSCVFCGGIGLLQKIHQSSPHKDELMTFLIVSFIFSFLFSVVMMLITWRGAHKDGKTIFKPEWKPDRKGIVILSLVFLASGVSLALNHAINLHLSGVIPSAVFFPIVNGGGLITATLASVFLFKEKLTAKQWVGLAFGVAAVLMLCL